jgi:DNA transposition AAA+ family ATPase
MTFQGDHVNAAGGSSMAPISNIGLFMAMVERVCARGMHLPGFGCFYGWPGLGKSQCCIYAQNELGAMRIEVGDSWTRNKFLRAILHEASVTVQKGTVSDLTDRVIQELGKAGHPPLVIDEADKLVDKGMVELLREIHEFSQVPIIMVGEERLPEKLRRWDRVYDRVLAWQPAQPCDLADTRRLAAWYAPKLTIADDLLDAIRRAADGRARRISTNLSAIAEWAATTGVKEIDLRTYGGRVDNGAPPSRRAS